MTTNFLARPGFPNYSTTPNGGQTTPMGANGPITNGSQIPQTQSQFDPYAYTNNEERWRAWEAAGRPTRGYTSQYGELELTNRGEDSRMGFRGTGINDPFTYTATNGQSGGNPGLPSLANLPNPLGRGPGSSATQNTTNPLSRPGNTAGQTRNQLARPGSNMPQGNTPNNFARPGGNTNTNPTQPPPGPGTNPNTGVPPPKTGVAGEPANNPNQRTWDPNNFDNDPLRNGTAGLIWNGTTDPRSLTNGTAGNNWNFDPRYIRQVTRGSGDGESTTGYEFTDHYNQLMNNGQDVQVRDRTRLKDPNAVRWGGDEVGWVTPADNYIDDEDWLDRVAAIAPFLAFAGAIGPHMLGTGLASGASAASAAPAAGAVPGSAAIPGLSSAFNGINTAFNGITSAISKIPAWARWLGTPFVSRAINNLAGGSRSGNPSGRPSGGGPGPGGGGPPGAGGPGGGDPNDDPGGGPNSWLPEILGPAFDGYMNNRQLQSYRAQIDDMWNRGDYNREKRPDYVNRLHEFMMDPEKALQDPTFKAVRERGLENLRRNSAAHGMGLSGNELGELQKYGQEMDWNQIQKERDSLMRAADLGNPAGMAQAAMRNLPFLFQAQANRDGANANNFQRIMDYFLGRNGGNRNSRQNPFARGNPDDQSFEEVFFPDPDDDENTYYPGDPHNDNEEENNGPVGTVTVTNTGNYDEDPGLGTGEGEEWWEDIFGDGWDE